VLSEPQPSPLPTRTVADDAVEWVRAAAAELEPIDHQPESSEVTGYATDVPMASGVMTVEPETAKQAAVTELWVHPELVREELAKSAPAPSAHETEATATPHAEAAPRAREIIGEEPLSQAVESADTVKAEQATRALHVPWWMVLLVGVILALAALPVADHFFFSGRSATQRSQTPAREALASEPARTWLFSPLHEPADHVILTVSNRNDVQATVRIRLLTGSHGSMPVKTMHVLAIPAGSGTELELFPPLGTGAFSLDASAPVLPHRWVIRGRQVHTMSGTPNPNYRTYAVTH
jgi:hypothetical protein